METVTTDSVAYVDVGQRKPHTVCLDGRIFETNDLRKLERPVVCLDAVFPSLFRQVEGLLERGVRVYYLRDTQLMETLRKRNNIGKSDETDARLLTTVPSEGLREINKDSLKLQGLLHQYYVLADEIRRNRQWFSLLVEEEGKTLVREDKLPTKTSACS